MLEDDDGLERRLDYVLANPLRAGVGDTIEDSPWTCSRYVPALQRF